MADQGLMTLDEAATYLGVAKITMRRWTRKGELTYVRIGKRGDRRFRRSDLDSHIRANSRPKPKKTGRMVAQKTTRASKRG